MKRAGEKTHNRKSPTSTIQWSLDGFFESTTTKTNVCNLKLQMLIIVGEDAKTKNLHFYALLSPAELSHQKVEVYSESCGASSFVMRGLQLQRRWMCSPGAALGPGTWHWRRPTTQLHLLYTPQLQFTSFHLKRLMFCYLGGLLTAFNLINSGLSEPDPVRDALQLETVPFHAL